MREAQRLSEDTPGTKLLSGSVCYPRIPPTFDLDPTRLEASGGAYGYWAQERERLAQQMLFAKLRDFEHEHEYRLVFIIRESGATPLHFAYRGSLAGVILGERFPREARRAFQDVLGPRRVRLYQVQWYDQVPNLFDPITPSHIDAPWLAEYDDTNG